MNTPAAAIFWQQTWRARWAFAAMAAYFSVVVLLVHGAPGFVATPMFAIDNPTVGFYLAAPFIWIAIALVAIFAFAVHNSRESGYPRHMFVLPMTTRALVFWPMLFGGIALGTLWLAVAMFVLKPLGVTGELWWATAPLVLTMSLTQVISWLPFAQSWIRILVAVPLYFFPTAAVAIWLSLEYSRVTLAAICCGVLPAVYLGGVVAVSRARRGEAVDWRWWQRLAEAAARRRQGAALPFRSAFRAQLWFECRGMAWLLPGMVLPMLVCVSIVLMLDRDNLPGTWRLAGAILFLPAFMANMIGPALAKQDPWSKYPLPAFGATRPLSEAQFVHAKFLMAALSALMAHAIVAAYLALALTFRTGAWSAIAQAASSLPAWKVFAIATALFAANVLIVLTGLVQRLWLGLTGRPWLIGAYSNALGLGFLAAMVISGWVFYLHPEWHPAVTSSLPRIVMALLLVKAVAASAVLIFFHRTGRLRLADIAVALGLWALVFGFEGAVIAALVPADAISMTTVLAAIALVTPLTRLAVAPLALQWNRHR